MRISTILDYATDPAELAQDVIAYEASGLDMVWVAEAWTFDSVSLLGYLAAVTKRVEIGAGIFNIYSRTPALLAMTAAGLDHLSEGRFNLGLGASGPQVVEGWHGVPYNAPVGRTREIIEICRQVWDRQELSFDGKHYQLPAAGVTGLGKSLSLINRPLRADIPIYNASLGPKNVELTAELCEGWIPVFFYPEKAESIWGQSLAAGFEKRQLGPLDIVAGGHVAIGDDTQDVLDAGRPMAALYIGGMGAKGKNFYNQLVSDYGFETEAAEGQDLYLAGKKMEAMKAVPAELLRNISLIGDPGFIRERLEAYRAAGVTTLNVTPVGRSREQRAAQIRALADIVNG